MMKSNDLFKSLSQGDFSKTASEAFMSMSNEDLQKLAEELTDEVDRVSSGEMTEAKKEDIKQRHEDENMAAATNEAPKVNEALENARSNDQVDSRIQPVANQIDNERTAEEELDEIIKEAAYAMAEEVLNSLGVTSSDYIFSKVADEDIAESIEKRASVFSETSGMSKLRIADDILAHLEAMSQE